MPKKKRGKRTDDPRVAGGKMIDAAGDPHAHGGVLYDSRHAVIVEEIETATVEGTSNGEPLPEAVGLMIHGRVNRPPDDRSAALAPHEPVSHLHLLSWEGAADLVVDIQSLAARAGNTDFNPMLQEKWDALTAKGLTEKKPPPSKGEP